MSEDVGGSADTLDELRAKADIVRGHRIGQKTARIDTVHYECTISSRCVAVRKCVYELIHYSVHLVVVFVSIASLS